MSIEGSIPTPSTKGLMLTISFRRAEVTAFWIVLTIAVSLTLAGSSAALGARLPTLWGASGLTILLPGMLWPAWFEWGVRGWNKGVKLSAAVLRRYVLKVYYYVMFAAVARSGASLELMLSDDERSRWILRSAAPIAHAKGGWMFALLPLTFLLFVLGDDAQDTAPPSATYTLY